ncbi:MAG: hypothetical protein IKN42_00075 [Elusimicrobia bacterium]|nr:hypothetical protein [Elusimicrobiota bacterium]
MKKLSVVVMALLLCAGMSFAARGGTSSSSGSSSKSTSSSSSSSSGNFGIGYSKISIDAGRFGNGNINLDQVAARYWFSDSIGADFALGFTTGDAQAAVLFSAKVIGSIFKVNKLTLYWLAGAGFGSYDPKVTGANSMSVVMINGGVGAEYYVLPCLSVLTEMGIRYTSVSANGTSFSQTGIFADWLPQAGVRFYF